VTDQPTADRIRAAIADAVTINAGPLIDHAASGVLYALGLAEVPPADGAPGPLTRVTDHTHTGPREACNTSRFGETCGHPATEHQLHDGADPLPVSTCPRTDRHGYHLWPERPDRDGLCPGHPAPPHASERPETSAATGAGWRALAFNAIGPVLRRNGQWLPLNVRAADAEAVLDAIGTDGSRRREPSPACDDMLLTADEARAEVDRLARELYLAQDALDYVAEWCDLTDRKQLPITTADVRTWLKGARCGRQLAADRAAVERASEPTEPGTTASDDGLREQYAAAIWERQNPGRQWADCEYRWRADAEADADAVMAVRDRHMEQLTAGRATWKAKAAEIEAHRDQLDETARRFLAQRQEMAAERHGWQQRAETAEATLAAIRDLGGRLGLIDPTELLAALDRPTGQDPAEDIDDWGDGATTAKGA
jgi:hypothetical protein